MPEFRDYRAKLVDTNAHNYVGSEGGSAYTRDEGLLVIPVMGPAGTAPTVVRVHAPYGLRRSRFASSKQYAPPIFPAPADTETGDVILQSNIHFPLPEPSADGVTVFGVSGEYLFVQPGDGRSTEDTFPMDKHPYPTAVDRIDQLPPPSGDTVDDMTWHWNCSYYDVRILGGYDLLG